MLYDDGGVACAESELVIRRYYLWGGPKRIPYTSIRAVTRRRMSALSGKWRIWGSGNFTNWWNLDWRRPKKTIALVIDVGRRILPTITPDDPDAVQAILTSKQAK